MTPFQNSLGTIIQINLKLFVAAVFAVTAHSIWPTTPEWWGLGVIAILMGAGALSLLVEAIGMALKLYQRDKAIAAYLAQGSKPKSSVLVSGRDLDDAEMR
jgi:ABC-type Co2+ transport system permease subunit